MKILAHRGYWNENISNNSIEALRLALEKGFGFESDIRDYCGKLVISHNIADEKSLEADIVFKMLKEYEDKFCFAINIKADGLKDLLDEMLTKYDLKEYFIFDMSVPQMIEYQAKGMTFFTRQSEYEETPCMYEQAQGVWIDAFESEDWINKDLIISHLNAGKKVCIVSPDLHKREYLAFWTRLKELDIDSENIMLCTDYPVEAREFFDTREKKGK